MNSPQLKYFGPYDVLMAAFGGFKTLGYYYFFNSSSTIELEYL